MSNLFLGDKFIVLSQITWFHGVFRGCSNLQQLVKKLT